MDLPPEAVEAALAATLKRFPCDHEGLARDDVTAALEAAAPHLAAAVREACAQLAERHGATAGKCAKGIAPRPGSECGCRDRTPRFPFAALLRGGGEGGGT